ncbi:MAG: MBL fold metallo-hydrolase [bacterium]
MNKKVNGVDQLKKINVKKDNILINWIGQAGFIFKTGEGTTICIDPYLSNSMEKLEETFPTWVNGKPNRRMWFNKFTIEEFEPDYVICTHDHVDHTDPETIPLISAYSEAVFCGPGSSIEHMKKMSIADSRLKTLERNQNYKLNDIDLKTVYAEHTEDSIGLVLNINNLNIYITGDTSYEEELFEINEDINILISCINGKLGNLNIDQAVELAKHYDVELLLPMHYGLIPSNTANERYFIQECEKNNINTYLLNVEHNYILQKENNRIEIRDNT